MPEVAKSPVAEAAPRVRVREVLAYERPVRLRLPFRFGVVTFARGARKHFVHAEIAIEGGGTRPAHGRRAESAEMVRQEPGAQQ